MLKNIVINKLKTYFEEENEEYLDRDILLQIFDESKLEISDETGWHSIEALWVEDDDFYAAFMDETGEEDTDIIILSDNELKKLNNWLS